MLLDMTARTMGGPDAAMTSQERQLVEGPLKRTLGKYGAVTNTLTTVADPVALVVGFGMWGSRIMASRAQMIETQQQAERRVLVPGQAPGQAEERGTPPVQQPLGETATFVPAPVFGPETEMLDAAGA